MFVRHFIKVHFQYRSIEIPFHKRVLSSILGRFLLKKSQHISIAVYYFLFHFKHFGKKAWSAKIRLILNRFRYKIYMILFCYYHIYQRNAADYNFYICLKAKLLSYHYCFRGDVELPYWLAFCFNLDIWQVNKVWVDKMNINDM